VQVDEQVIAPLAGPQLGQVERRLDAAVRRLVRIRVDVVLVAAGVVEWVHSMISA
jgi:hypothetical protein